MTRSPDCSPASPQTPRALSRGASALAPLTGVLRRELHLAGLALPGPEPDNLDAFTRWYLESVQVLEAYCAADADHPGMLRAEVELMCRAALTGRDLGEVIAICAAFTRMLHPRAGKLTLGNQPDLARVHLDSLRNTVTSASQLVDVTGLFAFHQLFQWLTGTRLQLLQVYIGPIDRSEMLPFLTLFGAPVLAGGDHYALDYPRQALGLPVVRTGASFDDFFRVYPCGIFQDTEHPLDRQVASMMSASLRQGQGVPSQAGIAAAMGLPLSTFRRRLADTGETFSTLRARALDEAARHALAGTAASINDIAAQLGFSDAASFRRAFRSRHGMSPRQWRQGHDNVKKLSLS